MDENKNWISTSKAWSVLRWYNHPWRCFRKGTWEDYLTGVEEGHRNIGVALRRTWLMWRGGSVAKMINPAKCELLSRAALLVLLYPVPTAGQAVVFVLDPCYRNCILRPLWHRASSGNHHLLLHGQWQSYPTGILSLVSPQIM